MSDFAERLWGLSDRARGPPHLLAHASGSPSQIENRGSQHQLAPLELIFKGTGLGVKLFWESRRSGAPFVCSLGAERQC
jgi:hypothetical protein